MNDTSYTFTYESIPKEKNIYYMFQRLVTPIIISTTYKPYIKYWNEYKKLLNIVMNWIEIYFNTKDLKKIDTKYFDEVDTLITDLKFSCLEINTIYIEEIDIWHNEFLKLWEFSH